MSENVDWGSPAPEPTPTAGESDNGATDNNSGGEEYHHSTQDLATQTGALGIPSDPIVDASEGEKPKPRKAPERKSDTDSERADIPEQKEEVEKKPVIPRLIEVNGEKITEEELIRRASKATGAETKFEEAARVRKQQQAFMEQLTADPLAVLSDNRIDIDRKALAEKWLMDELERESQDPRDAKIKEYEAREAQATRAEQQRIEQEKQREFQEKVEKSKAEIGETIGKAMENTRLSKNPQIAGQVLREMAMYMRASKQQGIDVTPEELVTHVETSRLTGYHTLANSLEGEELIDFLGKDVIKKIRRADLKRLKGSGSSTSSAAPKPTSKPTAKKGKSIDPYDALKKLGF